MVQRAWLLYTQELITPSHTLEEGAPHPLQHSTSLFLPGWQILSPEKEPRDGSLCRGAERTTVCTAYSTVHSEGTRGRRAISAPLSEP
jgi:hypothetical protein